MRQQALYRATKMWLEEAGFRALITGEETKFVVPMSDLAWGAYMVPDLIGIDKVGRLVIVEAEKDRERFFEALGRCMLWKCFATFVYLVYPKGEVRQAGVLAKLGVGFLEVDIESQAVNDVIRLPREGDGLRRLWELHPFDFVREQQLARQIRNILQ